MIRLSDTRTAHTRSHQHDHQSTILRATSAPLVSDDRLSHDAAPRAEALTAAATGLPVGAGEPALPPPVYEKGPHYFCPAGFEGTALDPLRLAEQFMALPEDQKGNFFNAICCFNAELGSALNSTLRDIRGADVQKNWLTHMDTLQGSTFGVEGLPAWLVQALSTSATPPPGGTTGTTGGTTTTPVYTKGPSYFCPTGFEGTDRDPLRLAEYFMSLPEEQRGNFFNAVCCYNAELGSALNSTLRDIRGADVQKQWVNHMDTLQGSTFGREGLPPWLLSALGG